MRVCRSFPLYLLLSVLAACKTDSVINEIPALIDDPTPDSHAEIIRIVSGALHVDSVRIAEDALTGDSVLIIEPAHLLGRDFRKPEHFALLMSDSDCVLVHQETGERFLLSETRCRAQ
jgi:hypothetical protein